MSIRCLIVDHDALSRQSLRYALEPASDLQIVGEVSEAIEALEKVGEVRPDVVLMDISSSELSVLETARRIANDPSGTRVILLAGREDEEYLGQSLEAGISGYVLKDAPPSKLIAAVREVHQGRKYLSPQVLGRLVDDFRSRHEPGGPTRGTTLTPRELEVLRLIAQGNSVKEVAQFLGLSVKTVEAHKFNLMRKLDIHNKAQLVIYAIQKKILELPTGT
jgi:two-component system, NarL family, response regulator NreC